MPKREPSGPAKRAPRRPRERTRVGEAQARYIVPEGEDRTAYRATTRLSSKHQITLPVAMVRRLGLRPGDEISLLAFGAVIHVERLPRTPEEWIARLHGSMADAPEWRTKEDIDAWIRRERESWDRDEQADS